MNVNPGTEPAMNSVPVIASTCQSESRSEIDRLQVHLTRMTALTELVAHIESADDVKEACQVLVEQLKAFLSVDQVVIGLCGERSIECKLTAVSDVLSFHPRGELAVAAQAAMQECVARNEAVHWPAADVNGSGGLMSHRQYADTADVPAIFSSPLRDAKGQLRGVWMVIGEANDVHNNDVTNFLHAAESPMASALNLVERSQKGRLQHAIDEVRQWSRERRGRAIMTAIALFALILCIPLHYHPTCDCTIEPVTRRYVAAPFAGPLEKAMVEPGDIVEAGQVLARMDGREVRMQLSGTRADLHRATKERAGHLATHESGQSEVARHEVDRLKIRTELLEHREHNVEILSPIAGVVVSGDLEDAEGMPLEIGQTLFEIAPLDEMVVEVGIAEDDFAYVRDGMPVSVRLDAFPLRRFTASIRRVHPRAELRDDANVFIAEVHLESPGLGLRPGMRGTARVESDRYPLVWNLFRRPITATVAWLGW